MNALGFPLLSIVLWLPALGAVLLLLTPRSRVEPQRQVALTASLLTLATAVPLVLAFDRTQSGLQFVDRAAWIPQFGIVYALGVDGINLWLVLLAALLTPLAIAASWGRVEKETRSFYVLLLLLESAMIGAFTAQDLFLFYVFFELTLVPVAWLIGVWGSGERVRAATKFFVYNFAGSVFMLIGIIVLYLLHGQATGTYTFDLTIIRTNLEQGLVGLSVETERWLFAAFFFAFAVKAPLWPFHTWMPDAQAAAPSDGSVDIAGLMLKLGPYGLIRFNLDLFPEAARWAAPAIGVLAVISILYAAAVAFAQTDLKRLLSYATISHVGLIVLSIFSLNAQGLSGAVLQTFNSGLTTSALFFVVGLLYARTGSRDLNAYGGVWTTAPFLGGLALVLVLSSIGVPGLNNFPSEFAAMAGAWISPALGYWFVFFAAFGVILAPVYLLRMYRRVFMGPVEGYGSEVVDLTPIERGVLVLPVLLALAIGLYPNMVFETLLPTLNRVAEQALLAIR